MVGLCVALELSIHVAFVEWRSGALWFGALGPQVIQYPAAGALDDELGKYTLAQFLAASAAPDFFHLQACFSV